MLAAHNLVQNLLLNERGYVAGNMVVSGALIGLGRVSGLSWDEMGLHPKRARAGLRLGSRVAAGAVVTGVVVLANPRHRPYLLDDRAPWRPGAPIWRRALVRFPLGTALFEEVAFRGVLPAMLRSRHPSRASELVSAGVFAAWHLIPTARALAGNPLGRYMSPARRVGAILAGSALAGGFGLIFTALRRRSGSLVAPWLAHSALNACSYLAAVAAWKLTSPGGYPAGLR